MNFPVLENISSFVAAWAKEKVITVVQPLPTVQAGCVGGNRDDFYSAENKPARLEQQLLCHYLGIAIMSSFSLHSSLCNRFLSQLAYVKVYLICFGIRQKQGNK